MSTKHVSEKLAETARGEDKPIDEKRPGIPYIFMTAYPILLVVVLLALLAFFYFFRT